MARSLLHRFSNLLKVDLVYEAQDGALTAYFSNVESSPLMQDAALRSDLRSAAEGHNRLCTLRHTDGAYYLVQSFREGWLYLGPMCNSKLDPLQQAEFYRSHGIAAQHALPLRTFTLRKIKDISVLVASMIRGTVIDEESLFAASFDEAAAEREMRQALDSKWRTEEAEREESLYRHTYQDEQRMMQAVQEGRSKDAIALSEEMDSDTGRFAAQELSHWRTLATISITLVARGAIHGGVSPANAYRLSGFFISKCVEANDCQELLYYRNSAIEELCAKVNKVRQTPNSSPYTAKCKDYIRKHFREKIYVEDIADSLGISEGYLSKLFKKETGSTIQDYVNRVRVDRASDLLIYSDMSLPAIASYVHFPTQSYFGKIFKQFKGMTPNDFRKRNKVGEVWK